MLRNVYLFNCRVNINGSAYQDDDAIGRANIWFEFTVVLCQVFIDNNLFHLQNLVLWARSEFSGYADPEMRTMK